MSTTAQAFIDFLIEIKPTEYQKDTLIPVRKKSALENLQETFPADSDMPFWKAYLIGSADKGTIIRPIEDTDVLAVFSNEDGAYSRYENNSQDFLYRIREAYDGVSIQQVGARGQAVRVFFDQGGHVDIAPVFFVGGDDFLIPAGDGSWLRTSPLKANAWFEERHKILSYHLKNTVCLLKKWNREHSSHFKSFHLETVTAALFVSLGSDYRDTLTKFFFWAPENLDVVDPGGHSGVLSSYLTTLQRSNLISALNTAYTRANKALEAENAGDHEEAKRLWSIILGNDFPS